MLKIIPKVCIVPSNKIHLHLIIKELNRMSIAFFIRFKAKYTFVNIKRRDTF